METEMKTKTIIVKNDPAQPLMTNAERITTLYLVLKSYAPEDWVNKRLDNFTSRTETTEKEIIHELVTSLADGLLYGNWPWVVAAMKEKK